MTFFFGIVLILLNRNGRSEIYSMGQSGQTGFLFPPDNPQGCADALGDVLDSKGQWDRVRENGVEHVKTRHDWHLNVQRYLAVYQLLLARINRDDRSQPIVREQGLRA